MVIAMLRGTTVALALQNGTGDATEVSSETVASEGNTVVAVDLLSEGEIDGVVMESNIPVYNIGSESSVQNGVRSFTSIREVFRNGTINQSPVNGFIRQSDSFTNRHFTSMTATEAVEEPLFLGQGGVSTDSSFNTPKYIPLTNRTSHVDLKVQVQNSRLLHTTVFGGALFQAGPLGKVDWAIRVSVNNSNPNQFKIFRMRNIRSNQAIQEFNHRVILTDGVFTGNYDRLIVERLNVYPDALPAPESNGGLSTPITSVLDGALIVNSYSLAVNYQVNYAKRAVSEIIFNSNLSRVNTAREYRIRGIKVNVPDPNGITNGVWNGNFLTEKQWSDNPAWILYDLYTNKDYGLGSDDTDIKFSLFKIAQYCDEMVTTEDVTEKRYRCNVVFSEADSPHEVFKRIASIFGGETFYDSSGNMRVIQNRDNEDATYFFCDSNASKEGFRYEGYDVTNDYSHVKISWRDFDNKEQSEIIDVDSYEGGTTAFNQIETEAFGSRTRGQSLRSGTSTLLDTFFRGESVEFETSFESQLVSVGDIIVIADNHRVASRPFISGRAISSSNMNSVVFDRDIPNIISSLGNLQLHYVDSSGSFVSRDITGISGRELSLNLGTSNIEPATPMMIYTIDDPKSSSDFTWRVISKSEESAGVYRLRAVKYVRDFDSQVEAFNRDNQLTEGLINPTGVLPTPTSISIQKVATESTVSAFVNFEIEDSPFIDSYQVCVTRPSSSTVIKLEQTTKSVPIDIPEVGNYQISVRGQSSITGIKGPVFERSIFIDNTPELVTPLRLTGSVINNDTLNLSWDSLLNAQYQIRYTPRIAENTNWDEAFNLVPPVIANEVNVANLAGTYFIRAVRDGVFSEGSSFHIQQTSENTHFSTIKEFDFIGSGVTYSLVDSSGNITVNSGANRRNTPDTFFVSSQLGSTDSRRVIIEFDDPFNFEIPNGQQVGFNLVPSSSSNARASSFNAGLMSEWQSLSSLPAIGELLSEPLGNIQDIFESKIEVRLSPDGTNFSDWEEVTNDIYSAKAIRVRARINIITDMPVQVDFSQLKLEIKMQNRSYQQVVALGDLTGNSYTFTYDNTFYEAPSIAFSRTNSNAVVAVNQVGVSSANVSISNLDGFVTLTALGIGRVTADEYSPPSNGLISTSELNDRLSVGSLSGGTQNQTTGVITGELSPTPTLFTEQDSNTFWTSDTDTLWDARRTAQIIYQTRINVNLNLSPTPRFMTTTLRGSNINNATIEYRKLGDNFFRSWINPLSSLENATYEFRITIPERISLVVPVITEFDIQLFRSV